MPPNQTTTPPAASSPTPRMSSDQFAQSVKAKYPQYSSVDNTTLAQKMIAKYPQYGSRVDFGTPISSAPADQLNPPAAPEEDPGLVQGLVRGVVSPFARLGANAYNAGRALTGAKDMNAPINLGNYLGKFTPVGQTGNFANDVADSVGTGAEIGSYLIPGEGAIGKASLLRKLGAGTAAGATSGALQGGGQALEQGGGVGDVALGATGGAVSGAFMGAMQTASGAALGKVLKVNPVATAKGALNTILHPISAAAQKAQNVAESPGIAGKTIRRVQDVVDHHQEVAALPEHVQNAVKADIPQSTASFVHGLNPDEKRVATQMLDLQEKGVKGGSSQGPRAENLIGNQVLQRVQHVENENGRAGATITEALKNVRGSKVDYGSTAKDFYTELRNLGITIGDDGKLDFSKSQFRGPATAKDRQILGAAHQGLQAGEQHTTSANDLHTTRQALFHELSGRPKDDPYASETTRIVEGARRGMLKDMGDQLGEAGMTYKEAATKYATTQKALTDFYNLMGKKWAGRPDAAISLRAGEVGRRVTSNASADSIATLNQLEGIARQHGFKSNVNIHNLADFNEHLKSIVGDTQKSSLAGTVERANKAAASEGADIAGHVASGNHVTAFGKVLKFAKGNSQAEQIRALRGLLEGASTEPPKIEPPSPTAGVRTNRPGPLPRNPSAANPAPPAPKPTTTLPRSLLQDGVQKEKNFFKNMGKQHDTPNTNAGYVKPKKPPKGK